MSRHPPAATNRMTRPLETGFTRASGISSAGSRRCRTARLGDDALRFVDWLADAGQRWWQILPFGPPDPLGRRRHVEPVGVRREARRWLHDRDAPVDVGRDRGVRGRSPVSGTGSLGGPFSGARHAGRPGAIPDREWARKCVSHATAPRRSASWATWRSRSRPAVPTTLGLPGLFKPNGVVGGSATRRLERRTGGAGALRCTTGPRPHEKRSTRWWIERFRRRPSSWSTRCESTTSAGSSLFSYKIRSRSIAPRHRGYTGSRGPGPRPVFDAVDGGRSATSARSSPRTSGSSRRRSSVCATKLTVPRHRGAAVRAGGSGRSGRSGTSDGQPAEQRDRTGTRSCTPAPTTTTRRSVGQHTSASQRGACRAVEATERARGVEDDVEPQLVLDAHRPRVSPAWSRSSPHQERPRPRRLRSLPTCPGARRAATGAWRLQPRPARRRVGGASAGGDRSGGPVVQLARGLWDHGRPGLRPGGDSSASARLNLEGIGYQPPWR